MAEWAQYQQSVGVFLCQQLSCSIAFSSLMPCFLGRSFFDVCDGIFLNYTWKEGNLDRSLEEAGERATDVFVGVDVFGRGCLGGGGFNSIQVGYHDKLLVWQCHPVTRALISMEQGLGWQFTSCCDVVFRLFLRHEGGGYLLPSLHLDGFGRFSTVSISSTTKTGEHCFSASSIWFFLLEKYFHLLRDLRLAWGNSEHFVNILHVLAVGSLLSGTILLDSTPWTLESIS